MVKVTDPIDKVYFFIRYYYIQSYEFIDYNKFYGKLFKYIFGFKVDSLKGSFVDKIRFKKIVDEHIEESKNYIFTNLCNYLEKYDCIYTDNEEYEYNCVIQNELYKNMDLYITNNESILEMCNNLLNLFECKTHEILKFYRQFMYLQIYEISKSWSTFLTKSCKI